MHARKQYLEEIRKEYEQADLIKRGRLLDEAQKRTRMNRKYLIRALKARTHIERPEAIYFLVQHLDENSARLQRILHYFPGLLRVPIALPLLLSPTTKPGDKKRAPAAAFLRLARGRLLRPAGGPDHGNRTVPKVTSAASG